MMSSLDNELAELIQVNKDMWTSNLSTFASFAFLAYDTLITMDQEVKYVWKSRWSVPKVLYLLNRWLGLGQALYGAIVAASWSLPAYFCAYAELPLTAFWQDISCFVADVLLTMRVQALYGDDWRVRVMLLTLFFANLSCNIVGAAVLMRGLSGGGQSTDIVAAGCLRGSPGAYFKVGVALSYGSACVFAGSLFLLTLVRVYPALRKHGLKTPLMSIFLRDGGAHFAMILTTYLVTMICLIQLTGSRRAGLSDVTTGWTAVAQTAICSRMFVNLRGAARPSYASTYYTAQQDVQIADMEVEESA